MATLSANDFAQFFQQLHDKPPFPWQVALAKQVCEEGWPQSIDLPTASGKTACIDIALFALAVRGDVSPRRIFFVVDRRVVVQEAFERAKTIRARLTDPGTGAVLCAVTAALRELAGGEGCEPLSAFELRGGTYRDEEWVRRPLQPAVIATTVDQIGSRLLFRGYGIKDLSWPIHAGMIANDSIVILDEAHCSKPFGQTLSAIEKYRGPDWAEAPLGKPFHFVEMTATPSRVSARPFRIGDKDRENEVLRRRLLARKPVMLLPEAKGRKNDFTGLADALVQEALRLAAEVSATRVGLIVNRVATAKRIYGLLKKDHNALLMIGRMRPFDRDSLTEKLEPLKSGADRVEGSKPVFVISTQCLEVGADLDFDVLVSECAGVDALLQRFGRLDRTGAFGRARGSIAIASWQTDSAKPDAVYGPALANTWAWLKNLPSVDFGIESEGGEPTVREALAVLPEDAARGMRMETAGAPVLLPGHLDAWAQTSTAPMPDPEPSLFLHGPVEHAADVQLVWRGDLGDLPEKWAEIVALCPPVAREAMPVQYVTFLKWMRDQKNEDDEQSDLDGRDSEEGVDAPSRAVKALIWRPGKDDGPLSQVKPGDTIVLPTHGEAWKVFGHFPDNCLEDAGDAARFDLKRKLTLRVHPGLIKGWEKSPLNALNPDDLTAGELAKEIKNMKNSFPAELQTLVASLPDWRGLQLVPYPSGKGYVLQGWLSREKSQEAGQESLVNHTKQVRRELRGICSGAVENGVALSLDRAAEYHDTGKRDPRFQAWLRGGDSLAVGFSPHTLAKSGLKRLGKQVDSGLPQGFRHELVSLLLAEQAIGDDELALHLIASHHGYCRPFAPVVRDGACPCIEHEGLKLCRETRLTRAAHRLGSGVPERFWRLTRRYGWWGLAYLEGLLRVADWRASETVFEEVDE